ncbi:unnamed protein product [Phyllotreta striolata]|uniref:Potassium channel domain-containing protein n=1 Tax=Phyllotreta striolata TaxID=444603 RepID=A0A9N9XSG6_PHYSR|nr:unnamed protein product [Phyllotreta striolata]
MKAFQNVCEGIEEFCLHRIPNKYPTFIYFLKSCLILFFGTFIPGYVFTVIEGQLEKDIKLKEYPRYQERAIISLHKLSQESLSLEEYSKRAESIIIEFESTTSEFFRKYPLIMSNMEEEIWCLWTGFFYSYTVYTTLGYGEMYPLTTAGRVLTIVYAIVGIPLFLLFLRDLGKLFTRFIKYEWMLIRRVYYRGTCKKPSKHLDVFVEKKLHSKLTYVENKKDDLDQTSYSESTVTRDISTFELDDEFNIPIPIALVILTVYIFIGALLYTYFEKWDVFDSFYYVFICLSTIGFGDFIPHNPTCEVISLFYECFGKAFMAMTIDTFSEQLHHKFHASLKSDSDIWDDMEDTSEPSLEDVEQDAAKDKTVHRIIYTENKEDEIHGIRRTKSAFVSRLL